jgi:V/A-type H+-transporting ATPase subunit C
MNNAARYSAVNTKIRAIGSRFLNNEDFENLLHKKSVAEVAAYLKRETHYRDVLGGIDENDIHRDELEILIKKDHARQIEKLEHYFYSGYREFYRYVLIKREVDELKTVLRSISNKKNNNLDRDSFALIGRLDGVKIDDLLSSGSTAEFIRNLRGTIYYKYLEPLAENDRDNLFMDVMTLDLAYFDIFYKNIGELSSRDRPIVDYLQGTNVDLLNIQWIYRGIKFYNLSREVLFNYTIPHGWVFKRNGIKELCYSQDLDEFQKRILNTRYKFLFDNENNKDIFMERRILRYQYFNIKRIRNRYEMNISQAIAFDVLLEYEIRDLATVIESIRYDMPFEEAKKFLIRKL